MPNGEPNEADIRDLREGEFVAADKTAIKKTGGDVVESTAGLIASGELDQQITTAHKFPRSVTEFRKEAMSLATLNEGVAEECLFALRRENSDGSVKVIEGPSIRLAEIIAYSWRNCRIGSRIVLEGAETVVVQGVFQDVERNVVMTSEVSRSIMNKHKRRYSRDMITVTTNAAQAIAKRNAITAGVPRALWWDVYQKARQVAAGNAQSLSTKISKAVKAFAVYGITIEQILALLKRGSEIEITQEDVLQLIGIYRSIKDEEVTPEEAFPRTVDIADLKRETGGNGTKEVAETSTGTATDNADVSVRTAKGPIEGDRESAASEADNKKPRSKRAPPPAME